MERSAFEQKARTRTVKFRINQIHRVTELCSINEIPAVCHPKGITCHIATDIDNCASHCNLNLFYLIEDKQTKFLIKTIEHHHLAERCVRFITMLLLWQL